MATGNDLTIYVDPVNGSDGPGSTIGAQNNPCQTFGKGMQLLLGTQLDRGQRVLQLVTGGVLTSFPASNFSWGTPGWFAFGGLGPLGGSTTPILIQAPLTNEFTTGIGAGIAGNVVSLNVPQAVMTNQYRDFYMYDGLGQSFTIRSNTSNGIGGNVDFTLENIPGGVYAAFGGNVFVGRPSAQIEVGPVGNEYEFDTMQIGLIGVEFVMDASTTLTFRGCNVYTQGVWATVSGNSFFALERSALTSNPQDCFDKWGGVANPTQPFAANSPNAICFRSDGTGQVIVDQAGSLLAGPVFAQSLSLSVFGQALTALVDPYFTPSVEITAANNAVFGVNFLEVAGVLNLAAFLAIASDVAITGCQVGGAAIGLSFSKGVLADVVNYVASAIVGPAMTIQSQSQMMINGTTTLIGSTGVALVAQHLVVTYAALTGNANPPADAGGYTANDPSGHSTNCRIEILP